MKLLCTILAVAALLSPRLRAQVSPTSSLKTFCTAGKQVRALSADKEAELFHHEGKGCLTHMWFGGQFKDAAYLHIRVYVDGEAAASIDMELFMGTGIGFGDDSSPWGSEKMGRTGNGNTVYNTYRIPFGKSVRVTGQLAPTTPGNPVCWWIIGGTENLPVQIGGVTLPDNARLRLYKVENHLAQPLEEVALCDVPGAGALYQVTIAAQGTRHAETGGNNGFLEGCIRAYLNGEKEPTLLSSGFEDYFLGTYYFNHGKYANALAGVTHLDLKGSAFSAYRFHDADPVFFQRGLRLTARCGEEVGGKVIEDPSAAVYTTYAWLYQW